MNRLAQNLKAWIAILITVAVTACGNGDDYEGFDDTVGQSTPNKFLTFFNSQNGEYDQNNIAEAYYDAVDPGNARSTAQDFVALHGLDNPDVHVIFRDAKDLGYGRDMYMRSYPNPSICGGQVIAFLVRNFSVQVVEGFVYGPLNLEAAIKDDLQHHVGTNAIEFGFGREDMGDPCSSEPIAKFYTYQPVYDPPNAAHPRRIRVDLDGRGEKAMPQPCITCHGGKLRPLDRFGRFVAIHAEDRVDNFPLGPPVNPGDKSDIGTTKSRLQAFEVDTFEFSDSLGYRRADVEEKLRLLNAAVYCTYPGSEGHPACAAHGNGVAAQTKSGEWSGNFVRDTLLGWYDNTLQTPGSVYDGSFVPSGWDPSELPGRPQGTDALFTQVVGPNCFVCHGKRGVAVSSDVDFSTWEKFKSYADDGTIERLVFDEGRMPLGLLNYQNFWEDPEKAELLASFIEPDDADKLAEFEARRRDSNGKLIPPGRIVARAGPDRVTQPNASITLNAQASLFAESFSWAVLMSPPGSTTSISNPSAMKTDFIADTVGTYVVSLEASSSEGSSRGDTLDVKVVTMLSEAPRDIAFYPQIRDYLIAPYTPATPCSLCHAIEGNDVPVFWLDDALQKPVPIVGPYTAADPPALGFYEQFRARVNLEFIEDSLALKKPSGFHHNGGELEGFDDEADVGDPGRVNYDRFLNWIAEGAVCGVSGPECP